MRSRPMSPYGNRIRLLWQRMREPVIECFPKARGPPRNIEAYMKRVNDAYSTDAYHSLSIEGYRVTPAHSERVRRGTWNPESDEGNREQRNAMVWCAAGGRRGPRTQHVVLWSSDIHSLLTRLPLPFRARVMALN